MCLGWPADMSGRIPSIRSGPGQPVRFGQPGAKLRQDPVVRLARGAGQFRPRVAKRCCSRSSFSGVLLAGPACLCARLPCPIPLSLSSLSLLSSLSSFFSSSSSSTTRIQRIPTFSHLHPNLHTRSTCAPSSLSLSPSPPWSRPRTSPRSPLASRRPSPSLPSLSPFTTCSHSPPRFGLQLLDQLVRLERHDLLPDRHPVPLLLDRLPDRRGHLHPQHLLLV